MTFYTRNTEMSYAPANNADCWALGEYRDNGRFHARRIVWGMEMARAEKRAGEKIMRAKIYIRREPAQKHPLNRGCSVGGAP